MSGAPSPEPVKKTSLDKAGPEPAPDKPERGEPELSLGEALIGVAALGAGAYVAAKVAAAEEERKWQETKNSCFGCLFLIVLVIGGIGSACSPTEEKTEPSPSSTSVYGTR